MTRRRGYDDKPNQPAPIEQALAEWFGRHKTIAQRVEQAGIVAEWPDLVGPQVAAVTEPESITADGVLRVRVATAAWAQELHLMSPRIIARLNAGRTQGRVEQIRWIAGPLPRDQRRP